MFIWLIRLYGNGKCQKTGVTGVLLEHFVSRVALVA
jgi:hypothetical protein